MVKKKLAKAQASARALFTGGASEHMPTTELTDEDLYRWTNRYNMLYLVKGGLAPTRSEGRRNVEQGGVTVDGEKVTDFKAVVC